MAAVIPVSDWCFHSKVLNGVITAAATHGCRIGGMANSLPARENMLEDLPES